MLTLNRKSLEIDDSVKVDFFSFAFKFYFFGVIGLALIFLSVWLPMSKVQLTVISEPLIANFEINLDTQVDNPIFNLDTIGAKIIPVSTIKSFPGYKTLDGLQDKESGKAIVFKEKDLINLVDYKINYLLGNNKRVLDPDPKKWGIDIADKNFLKGEGKIKLAISEKVVYDYNLSEIRQSLSFKPRIQAQEKLNELPGIQKINIKIYSPCYRRMPIFPSRIFVSFVPI
ncbi:MAG: hypothetical protein PHG83_03510 [Patescibacteria group bacterium]|nr:hypothetical protein [Patescibacteria group bacterium]